MKSEPIIVKGGKAGIVRVKIYVTRNGDYTEFKVADYSTGARRFHSFADEQQARSKAKEIADAISSGEAEALTLRSRDRIAYVRALELLRPSGTPIEVVALHYAEAISALVLEACRYYARRKSQNLPRKTVSEVYGELLDAKAKDGASDVYLKDLRLRLKKFSDAFACQITDVTPKLIAEFLHSVEASGRTRNNFRRQIRTFFSFAESCGYIPRGHIDFNKDVAAARQSQTAIEIFTPEEMRKLLDGAQRLKRGQVHQRRLSNRKVLPSRL